jgi:transposase, IS5 family
MQPTQKGRNWYFGTKAHVGVDAESELVHTVIGTVANVHDIIAAQALLQGEETDVYADAGYQGIEKRDQTSPVRWHVAMRPSIRRKLNLKGPHRCDIRSDRTLESRHPRESRTSIPDHQATVWLHEDAIPGVAKNTAQITTLFALGNLWMVCKSLRKA